MPGKMIIVLEDDGMDSGCVHDILQECVNHGKVLLAKSIGPYAEAPGRYNIDLMHHLDFITPKKGRC